MSKIPKYSIIVHVANRKTLSLCLDSILRQTISKNEYEILLVDGGDKELFSSCGAKHLFKKGANPAELNNLGINAAKGEIIFFTDNDCIVPPNWMETLLEGYIRHPNIVGVGGWHEMNSSQTGFLQKWEDTMDNKFGGKILNMEIKTNLYFFPYIGAQPANLSYKKSVLEECGGFDESLHSLRWTAKEFNIKALARGYLFLHLLLKVKKIKKSGLKNFFYQRVVEGKDLFYLCRKYPKFINDIYGGFINNFLRLIAYAELNHFYAAYFFSNTCRILGRIIAKYAEQTAIKEINLSSSENFEISKRLTGEEKFIQTVGRPFNKSAFQVNELEMVFFSVIIPTHNRSCGLINALNHLIAQTIPKDNYEIIVVDDGSTDDTEQKISNFKSQILKPQIKYYKIPNGGPAKARNFGIKQAKGEIVFFTDDDCTVPKDWMETLLAGFKKYPDAVGVGGWIWPPEGELKKSAVSRFLHFESFSGHPIAGNYIRNYEILSNDPLMCFGVFAYNTANVCYKKEILKFAGGFREDFYWPGSEDNELAFRIARAGHQLLYLPFHVTHPKAMSLPEFTKLHFRRGANGYLFRTMHWELLEKLKPGFVKDYGSMASFVSRLGGPEKFLAFLEWLSLNAGIMHMKNKLAKCDKPVLSKPEEKISND